MPRAIPDDNLAYPVLVSIQDNGTGSGFFLNTENGSFFVTAKHVLFERATANLLGKTATLVSYPKDPTETGQNVFRLDLSSLLASGDLKTHKSVDVAVCRMAVSGKEQSQGEVVPGVAIESLAPSGVLGVGQSATKRFSQVLVANEVFLFGYPTSLGLKEIPQIDYSRPLLRKGIVAGKNDALKTLVLDCPVYWGNSGGPVLEVEEHALGKRHFAVIGVVSEFVPLVETWRNETHGYTNLDISNSGYCVAIPMDPVLELVSSWGTQPVAA